MAVTISIAGASDVDDLTAAFGSLVPQLSRSSPPPSRDDVQALLADPAATQFVARGGEGEIVGVATLIVFRIPTGLRAWIEDVIVDEGASRQGIGRALTEAMLDRARSRGCVTVDLTSRPSRDAANRLYRAAGFEQRDTHVYRYDLRPPPT